MAVASLTLLCVSFLPLVTISLSDVNASGSIDAWHSYGSCGMVIALAGIALWTVARFKLIPLAPDQNWPVIAGMMILLGTVLVLVRALVYSGEQIGFAGQTVAQTSLGYGAILVIVFGAASATAAAWRPL